MLEHAQICVRMAIEREPQRLTFLRLPEQRLQAIEDLAAAARTRERALLQEREHERVELARDRFQVLATELQHALIRSHAAGIGAPMPREVVRAMMLLRVRSLALGRSGVRPVLAQGLVDLLNHDITPWVPEHGSLGASGSRS